jgi:uncharacterized MAPEG superfamily protein
MTLDFELEMLIAAIVLGFVHLIAASHAASLRRGYRWTAGARDETLPPLAGVAGRLARAAANFAETFPYFAALVLAVEITGHRDAYSYWGAALYVGARVAYLPLYGFGVFLVRSLVWNVGTAGMVLLLVALLRV